MVDPRARTGADPVSESLYQLDSSDPRGELVDRSGVSAEDLAQIGRLMRSLSDLRDAEQRISEASQKYMRLSAQDMRAIHYLIVARNRGAVITPGMLTAHLSTSAASTTKLLNRLERAGHLTRHVHPTDRRAFAIEITPETESAAMQSVGRQQAKRFHAAARLSSEERDTVIRFLQEMTEELSLEGVAWATDAQDGAAGSTNATPYD